MAHGRIHCSLLQYPTAVFGASGSRTNIALNAAYSHGVSGTAIAVRFLARSTDPINELYIFLDATTGTRANVLLACDIYNEHATSATQPGSTLRDSATAVAYPASDDQWIKFTFGSPYSPAAIGETIWFVVYNTAGAPATDFAGIVNANNTSSVSINLGVGYSTTNGFSTAGTGQAEMPFVVVQGTESYGNPLLNTSTFFASNTRKRGMVFQPPVNVNLLSVEFSGSTALTGIQIFDNSQAPGDTPLFSYALGTDAGQSRDEIIGHKMLANTPLLEAGTTYYIVTTFATNTSSPTGGRIEDYSTYSAIFDDMIDNAGLCASVIDNGAGGWTVDNSFFPNLRIYVSAFPAAASGTRAYGFAS